MEEAKLWSAGVYYETTVPDTLDLAERAKLSLNHFTAITDDAHDYEMYWMGIFWADNPNWQHLPRPVFRFQNSPLMACQPKCMEAMAFARIASGSDQGLALEANMIAMLASHIGEEGVYWVPKCSGRPWLGPEEHRPFANVHGQARMMRAMMAWYQYTGDPSYKTLIDRMVDGMDRLLVVRKDDYAYFPTHGWLDAEYFSSCYIKGRGWRDTEEPADEKGGEEGSLFNHQGHTPGVLANWYMMTGNTKALQLSGELVRFLTKPKFWADANSGDYPHVMGAEHAHWDGHFYGHINTLRAILEYAIATNDVQLKAFVRDGYEWARQPWLMGRIGFGANGQGCAVPRLIGLAIKLSDAGVGDYWEDVDGYIRNHGTEMQFTPEDIPYLDSFLKTFPTPEQQRDPERGFPLANPEAVLQASMGAFAQGQNKVDWALCCSPWGALGICYAWDGTLRYTKGVARVNLLLNHAAPWMDIESWIPYEGRVVLRNKQAKEAFVRIPLWVQQQSVECRIGDRKAEVKWFGRYLWLDHLRAGDVITIEFPMQEADRYEPVLHPLFADMAAHYGTVILPARAGKPRDKAPVEGAVLIAERWIIAALRHHQFFSVAELNDAIAPLLDQLNARPLQRLQVSRRALFEEVDRPALRALPSTRYTFEIWKKATVAIDYHVSLEKHFYSVPYRLVGEEVTARLSPTLVEILHKGRRVASHLRSAVPGKHTTDPAHRPKSHQAHLEWSPSRLIRWAQETVGPQLAALVEGLLERRKHPEHGYRSCLGLMSLAKKYPSERMEAAAARAIAANAYSYQSVKSILATGLDQIALPAQEALPLAPTHENIRGRDYYR